MLRASITDEAGVSRDCGATLRRGAALSSGKLCLTGCANEPTQTCSKTAQVLTQFPWRPP